MSRAHREHIDGKETQQKEQKAFVSACRGSGRSRCRCVLPYHQQHIIHPISDDHQPIIRIEQQQYRRRWRRHPAERRAQSDDCQCDGVDQLDERRQRHTAAAAIVAVANAEHFLEQFPEKEQQWARSMPAAANQSHVKSTNK